MNKKNENHNNSQYDEFMNTNGGAGFYENCTDDVEAFIPESFLRDKAKQLELAELINLFDESRKLITQCYYCERKSIAQIAQETGAPRVVVENELRQARSVISDYMSGIKLNGEKCVNIAAVPMLWTVIMGLAEGMAVAGVTNSVTGVVTAAAGSVSNPGTISIVQGAVQGAQIVSGEAVKVIGAGAAQEAVVLGGEAAVGTAGVAGSVGAGGVAGVSGAAGATGAAGAAGAAGMTAATKVVIGMVATAVIGTGAAGAVIVSNNLNNDNQEQVMLPTNTIASETSTAYEDATELMTQESNNETEDNVTKPTVIKIMVDNTMVSVDNGAKEFEEYLEGLLADYGEPGKIDLQFTRPNHASYYDAVANAFNSNDKPDVVFLSSDYYALYAANGMLWDMTDAWGDSQTKRSGRLIDTADQILSALLVKDSEGNKGLYGFSPYRGNGCCTYIKKEWLDNAGIPVSEVQNKTLTFAQYYDILKRMKAGSKSSYVISAPGFITMEAPYTNYLPEFYQKAQYTFYKATDGKYVDGFTQQEMKDALQRIQTAVKDGIINKGSDGALTSTARDIFYSTNPTQESGVFTYWAGNWASTLKVNLEKRTRTDGTMMSGELIAIKPIAELGAYVERIAPAWCITADCMNPEGVFKYFIDTMLDGGDIQMAWEYGAKGTHWDTKAETFTLKSKDGKEGTSFSYEAGVFHFLPSPEEPSKLMGINHIDPPLALAKIPNDPGPVTFTQIAKDNAEFFSKNSAVAIPIPMTEALGNNIADINKKRNEIISKVARGDMTVDDGMADYTRTVGKLVDEVLKSLNE